MCEQTTTTKRLTAAAEPFRAYAGTTTPRQLEPCKRIERSFPDYKTGFLPLEEQGIKPMKGLEPSTPAVRKRCSALLSYIGMSAGCGSLSDFNPPCGLRRPANVSAVLCGLGAEKIA